MNNPQASNDSLGSSQNTSSDRGRQQTSSRMMKTTRRGRPFCKDTHDLFATLIVSLQLTTHRQYFKSYPNSFTTDEAAENLSALKFSQSNRSPDPRDPSRVITTTTTTTFSMNRDMAKGICQHFMDARLIENAADLTSSVFKDRGVYVLTPKGLHILERFITKNGINGEHLLKVFASQPICMKLLHLERRTSDDELLVNRAVVEVIFRRFVGRVPNYPYQREDKPGSFSTDGDFDRTMGVEMQDVQEKRKGKVTIIKHTFAAVAALDWLCDFTTICGRDEAAEVAAHFQRLGLIRLVDDRSRKDEYEEATIVVRGEPIPGRPGSDQGEFRCVYKAIYGLTDEGRWVARWDGYLQPTDTSFPSIPQGGRSSPVVAIPPRKSIGDDRGAGSDEENGSQMSDRTRIHHRGLQRRTSQADHMRNDYYDSSAGVYSTRDSNTNRLKQILEEPALRSLFREFLKQNFCEENLSFWLDVQDFKRRFHTTSSAIAVSRPEPKVAPLKKVIKGNREGEKETGFSAMEKHQQDLIGMAFLIYNTYLAPASPCELNIEHNLRSELVTYMTKTLAEASIANKQDVSQNAQSGAMDDREKLLAGAGGDVDAHRQGYGKAPLHASQLQTMVRLYERIQDHIFRLMATDSVPRFIKDARFLGLVRSVEEYAEALEAGRADPTPGSLQPPISKDTLDKLNVGSERSKKPGGGGGGGGGAGREDAPGTAQ